MGAALVDGLATIELGHHVPEALTLRETATGRGRSLRWSGSDQEQKRKQKAQMGPSAMPASDSALSPEHGSQSNKTSQKQDQERSKCNDHS
ncbi:hypothetical protein [Mesorhizobium sangaii]|uniref:Uncharacterized protein n=1 Tax=Mesorhizobium sangaii TaxID=505389 RepID=A0A841PR46_9HYPH|nr:hypothetical protein [Mesorhizobium sangaii]MBB6412542.1 hypothetical protein [Mesorhizobium sangaii]